MKRWLSSALPAFLVAAAVGAPIEEAERANVEAVGIQVVKALRGDTQKQSFTGRRTGTAVTLKVSDGQRSFVGFDGKASTLDAFTDDRGTELVTEAARLLKTWADGQSWVSDDGRSCLFDILSMKTPSRRAQRVTIRGKMVFRCGLNGTTAEQANFVLEKGQRLKAGPAPMKITGVQRGDDTTIFTLATKSSIDAIARISFHGPDGKEIDTELMDKAVVGFMGETFYELTYCLKTKDPQRIDSVTARVRYYRKIEKLAVPVHLTVGLGL